MLANVAGFNQLSRMPDNLTKLKTFKRENKMTNKVKLLARVTDDGYLLGCTDNFESGYNENYWSDYYENDDSFNAETIVIRVNADIVDNLLKHGTSEQFYGDGYEAWHIIQENS